MKCFTLSSYPILGPAVPDQPIEERYAIRHYPTPVPGLKLDWTDRCLVMSGGVRIATDQSLLENGDAASVVRDGPNVTVLRAGFSRESGRPTLTKDDSEDKALVYIDLTGSPVIRYKAESDECIVLRHQSLEFGATQEKVIAILEPFKSVVAMRNKRKWKRIGLRFVPEDRPYEELHIMFDGHKVFFNVKRLSA